MCRHEHELCQRDLRGLSKYEVNQHYFEFIRNATKEEREINGWGNKNIRGLYKCRICGEEQFIRNDGFKTNLKVCNNNCNGYFKRGYTKVIGYDSVSLIKVNWDEVEEVKNESDNNICKKIYLEHLPKYRNNISWKDSVGMIVPILYDNKEYNVIIDGYNKNKCRLIINILGFYKMNFLIHVTNFKNCKLGALINNVYANSNILQKERDLIINSIGKKESKKLCWGSDKKVCIKCPDCGNKHYIRLNSFIYQKFSCPFCSDGTSYPEKVIALLLDSLNIKFKKQLKFDGYKFLYDFYLIDYNIIIEVHGEQHYRDSGWKSYKEEHENDMIKYDIAVLNNYEYNKNYFVIDARNSNIEWLRNGVNNCLFFQQFNLNNINWEKIDTKAQKSKKIEVCLYWKEQKEVNKDLTTTIMAEIFKVSDATIRSWLAWGNENELCIYGSKEEYKARTKRLSKFVYLIKQDGTKLYEEAMSKNKLSELTGISSSTIYYRSNDGKPIKAHNSKYIGSYIVEEDKLEEFLLNLKGGDIIE